MSRYCPQLVGDSQPSHEDLLPAVVSWTSHVRHKTLRLCIETRNLANLSSTKPGGLAIEAEITDNNFSIERWSFWKLQLEVLEKRLVDGLGESIVQCVQSMKAAEKELGVDVSRS